MRGVLESNYPIRVVRSTYLDGTLVIPGNLNEQWNLTCLLLVLVLAISYQLSAISIRYYDDDAADDDDDADDDD